MCERFPALSPFDVRRQKGREVFLLIERLSDYNAREKSKKKSQARRPAGDNWF